MTKTENQAERHKTLLQIVRYGMVGAMNTLLTLAIIFLMKGLLDCNEWLSNAVGYTAGFINSFIWNKLWVFRSSKNFFRESLMFGIGFLVCYSIQALVTMGLYQYTFLNTFTFSIPAFTFSGYSIATIIGMVVYTIANFIYNRCITFR